MKVELVAQGFLKAALGQDSIVLELETGATVGQALAELGVRKDLVLTAAINNKVTAMSTVLNEGDRIRIIPYTGGG